MATSRLRLALRRWLDLAILAVLSGSIILVAAAVLRVDLRRFVNQPVPVLAAAVVFIIVVAGIKAWDRPLAFLGVRHFALYPPLWVAWLTGASGLLLSLGLFAELRPFFQLSSEDSSLLRLLGIIGLLATAVLFGASLVYLLRSRRQVPTGNVAPEVDEDTSDGPLTWEFDQLLDWIRDDTPVRDRSGDIFGHWRIANRIASRLQESPAPAQAIVGRLGAGKTTLRGLVDVLLHRRASRGGKNVRLVAVELWPFETPRAAVEGVIRALVRSVETEVSVLQLRGLPESYTDAMSAAGGTWSAVARLQGKSSNPLETLARIDKIATAIARSYVVWVEDLERFAGTAIDESESIQEAERLNPIRALLLGLERLESVTVVTATTTLHARFDLDKIARYVEELPELREQDVARLLGLFREGCLQRHDVIDPADPQVREELAKLAHPEQTSVRIGLGESGIYTVAEAVSVLCSTPRVLKQGLRAVLDIWDRLPGEIDFDDLFVMTIVRESYPSAFATIRKYATELRQEPDRRLARGGEVRKDPLQAIQSEELVPGDALRTEAILEIVKSVFFKNRELKPQGVAQRGHADYWQRYLAVPSLLEDERDQAVLRVLVSDDDSDLLDLLETPRSAVIEDFSRMIPRERLLRLLVPLVERRSHELPSSWPETEKDPPGLIPLWRMLVWRSESGTVTPEGVFNEVCRCYDVTVPRNLGLASAVEHYFVIPDSVHNMLRGSHDSLTGKAKERFRQLISQTHTGHPSRLIRALSGASEWVLLWSVWGLDRVRAGDYTGLPFEGWQPFAATILDATRESPAVMIPQLAGLLGQGDRVMGSDGPETRWHFDRDLTARLFGDVRDVLAVFRETDLSEWKGNNAVSAIAREIGVSESESG